jgi:dihydroorotate dehydrogenase electron transfer subunit
MMSEKPVLLGSNKIEQSFKLVKVEGPSVQRTLYFKIGKADVLPGQFYMLSHNGGQKPFSISHYDGDLIGFTIMDRGKCSKGMVDAKAGDWFGLTGPLGNTFTTTNHKSYLLIGGGVGTAPLFFLASHLQGTGARVDILFGARNSSYLDYSNTLIGIENYTIIQCGEDDSCAVQGLVTDSIEDRLKKHTYNTCCICGPEPMVLAAIAKVRDSIPSIEISMERYMKCGIGLCGSCVIDQIAARVCEDGPVFTLEELEQSKEFGNYHRNSEGIIEKF